MTRVIRVIQSVDRNERPPLTQMRMEVQFTPEQEAQISQIAGHNGTAPEQLVKETVNRMLEGRARFIAGVQKGIPAADRGELIEHDEVKSRIKRLLQS